MNLILLTSIPVWVLIPFVIMLLSIAVAPLVAEHIWESNRNKLIVSLILGIPTAVWLIANGMSHDLIHQMVFDYIPFIILLLALFVVTGGIHIGGNLDAKPAVNTVFLAIGAIIASFTGTTGAAMLLIRPLININKNRTYKVHTILFFIAVVANHGGLLTPLGDPPLFLLFLKGVPFLWFTTMLPEWCFVNGILLLLYFLIELHFYHKERKINIIMDVAPTKEKKHLHITGLINFGFLALIVLSVAFLNANTLDIMKHDGPVWAKFIREYALIAIILCSWFFTKKEIRTANKYTWTPIVEVAVLFIGIFATMTPALLFLREHAGSLGITKPWQFLYASGSLSAFLDNAPTALAFYNVAEGLAPFPEHLELIAGIPEALLKAVAVGSVFCGAMTYIGNGPNFMVKSIAEENGIKMPSFFGYMLNFSLVILLPVYILMQLIFI